MGGYRNDSLLYQPAFINRLDAQINFNWSHETPMKELNPDGYGVSWTGEVQAQFTGSYTFNVESRQEDWVRVWINEQLVIDEWRVWHPDGKLAGSPLNLVAGQRYLIRVEMYNNLGKGKARLTWSGPSMTERTVSQSQLYSQPTDSDENGLPDIWERVYFGHIGVNPNGDQDGDGLSNLQEYQYHTNPSGADTDQDGIPDPWEIAHGLDPQFNDGNLDYDHDGWNNLQKYQYGLDPFNLDANRDGLPDNYEVQYLGVDLSAPPVGLASVAASATGSQATNYLGSWQVDGNDIYALDRRGALDFNLSVSNADKYILNLRGTQNIRNPWQTKFKLLLSVDGQSLGQYVLKGGYGTNGEVTTTLPYLKAGPHTVRVFWDGAASFSSLRIKWVKLLAVSGADTNHNGIKDWADRMMADESGLDLTNGVISSYTSPVCLEGRDPYPLLMQITNNQTNALSPQPTSDGRWYVNAPLQVGTQTVFQARFQNGAVAQTRNLQWQAINLLTATNNVTIRKGDSLLFSVLPAGSTNGNAQISIGTNTFTSKAIKPVSYKFTTPGTFTVTGTYTSSSGSPQTGSLTVKVVQQNLPNQQPVAWTGMQRKLNLSGLAPEAVLQADSRLACAIAGTNAQGETQLTLGVDKNEARSVIARLGANGPVLDSTQVQGFDLWSGNQTYAKILQVYPDNSQLVEILLVSSPLATNVTFVLEPIVSGVMFEDGTIIKTLTSTNFDVLGQCPVRFIRPARAATSVCHSIKAYQGNYQLGYRH
jgi:hypothetical protein